MFFPGQILQVANHLYFLGIANAVLMVVPSMFIAATPVDAASKTFVFSGFIGACL